MKRRRLVDCRVGGEGEELGIVSGGKGVLTVFSTYVSPMLKREWWVSIGNDGLLLFSQCYRKEENYFSKTWILAGGFRFVR